MAVDIFRSVLIGLCIFLLARLVFHRILASYVRKKVFETQYLRVLHAPEFQVKSRYD
ncbi:MAG: hypothetical protein ACI8Y7_000412 [Candidatus Woesearchaeota archaeon]|jgi:hypothetical protein